MNELTLYYSSLCPDTVPFKAAMERLGMTAREVDITASMRNLKEFLRVRDGEEVFIPRKEQGMVGIPCLVTNKGEYLFEVSDLEERFAK